MDKSVLFEKITVFSKRLGRNVDLEAYNAPDGNLIISTKSLERFFDFKFCSERNIKTSKEVEKLTVDENGVPVYCLCRFELSDSLGYHEESFGESLPGTRINSIQKNNPFKIAELRAMSSGFIKYLELHGKVYSDTEMPIEEVELAKDDLKKVLRMEGKKEITPADQQTQSFAAAESEDTSNTKTQLKTNDDKNDMSDRGNMELPANNPTDNSNSSESILESAPVEMSGVADEVTPEDGISDRNNDDADDPYEQIAFEEDSLTKNSECDAVPDVSGDTEDQKKNDSKSQDVEKENENSLNTANSTDEFAPTEEDLNLIVFFGSPAGRNMTVKEVVESPEFATFVEKVPQIPKPLDIPRQKVVRALLKTLGKYTPEWENS